MQPFIQDLQDHLERLERAHLINLPESNQEQGEKDCRKRIDEFSHWVGKLDQAIRDRPKFKQFSAKTNSGLAEDLLSQAISRTFQAIRNENRREGKKPITFDCVEQATEYVHTTFVNLVKSWWKRLEQQVPHVALFESSEEAFDLNDGIGIDQYDSQHPSPLDLLIYKEMCERFTHLSPQHQQIVRCQLAGLTEEATGREVGLSRDAVHKRIARRIRPGLTGSKKDPG